MLCPAYTAEESHSLFRSHALILVAAEGASRHQLDQLTGCQAQDQEPVSPFACLKYIDRNERILKKG